jgi:hypothetical protein
VAARGGGADFSRADEASQRRTGFDAVTDPRHTPGMMHPLVRTHPVARRRCLMRYGSMRRIPGIADRRHGASAGPVLRNDRYARHRRDEFDGMARQVMHCTLRRPR